MLNENIGEKELTRFKTMERATMKRAIIANKRKREKPRTRRYVNDNEKFMEKLFEVYSQIANPIMTFEDFYNFHSK
jgi:predicted choloylglycine hydrolase